MSIEGKQAFNEFMYGVQLGAGEVKGAGTTWGTQTLVLTANSSSSTSASANTVSNIGAPAPVAATVKWAQIINTNGVAAVWEIASTTNTKAFVIAWGGGTKGAVIAATSVLNVAVAAGEQLYFNSPTAGATATLILGIETAN